MGRNVGSRILQFLGHCLPEEIAEPPHQDAEASGGCKPHPLIDVHLALMVHDLDIAAEESEAGAAPRQRLFSLARCDVVDSARSLRVAVCAVVSST